MLNHRELPDTIERLVDAYGASVYRIGLYLTGSEKGAAEVAVASLWTGALNLHAFEAEPAFRTWLCGIAAGAANERTRGPEHRRREVFLRKDRAVPDEDDRHGQSGEDWPDHLGAVATHQLRDAFQAAIAGLSAIDRTVLVLHDIEGLSVAQVAAVLRVDSAAVKTRLHRSRLFARNGLGRAWAGPAAPGDTVHIENDHGH